MLSTDFLLSLTICTHFVSFFMLYWLYQQYVSYGNKLCFLEAKVATLENEYISLSKSTSELDAKLKPIEESLSDVSRFTQTIDINIRLLIDKIDQAVKKDPA